jgi:AcrR family transcriptional regulator
MRARAARRNTREALLQGAAEEFARHGLNGARVQAIVQRTGINERMIYHHFGSKDGLYRAVLEDQWSAVSPQWRPTLKKASALGPREGMALALKALLESLLARPLLLLLYLHEAMSGFKALPAATLDQIPPELRELHARGQRSGVFRADCGFELIYLTALGALASIRLFVPRFKDLREQSRRDPAFVSQLAEQMLNLLLDGATIPKQRARRRKRGAIQ